MTKLLKFKSQLRTFLTALGAVLLSFNIGSENEIGLWVAFAFPVISAIWSWVDGFFNSIGSWVKKIVQTAVPLLVYYQLLTPEQTSAISALLFIVIALFPSEE